MAMSRPEALQQVATLPWYHSIDLGDSVVTNGQYDHRPYLSHYGLPVDLHGKTVLDIGAASGFFSFELERRGAQVTATELTQWQDHDFAPTYQPDQTPEEGYRYLHQPFDVAKQILGSQAQMKWINIYDISPETVGVFDVVFCGSVLIHLTDPLKALCNIARVTREKAIVATVIQQHESERSIATMVGHESGYCWWIPTRACFELMAVAAGFVGIEWMSDFQLNYRDQPTGPYHGVLHAYPTTDGWTERTRHRDQVCAAYHDATNEQSIPEMLANVRRQEQEKANVTVGRALQAALINVRQQEQEIVQLKDLVAAYERGRFIRLMRFLNRVRHPRS